MEEIKDLTVVDKGDFSDLYKKDHSLICVCKSPYIPIEAFKEIFRKIEAVFEADETLSNFIFDKRSLRSFHQPSMEWYFVNWKLSMLQKFGLERHYKILPDETWFKKCVEAGKHQIFEKYGKAKFDPLHIEYIESIEEGLR